MCNTRTYPTTVHNLELQKRMSEYEQTQNERTLESPPGLEGFKDHETWDVSEREKALESENLRLEKAF